MNATRKLLAIATLIGLWTVYAGLAAAVPPWQRLIPLQRIEADPAKSYTLTDQNGPWLIMATTFRGDKAEEHAKALVYELRKSFKLKAYTHKKVYDFTGEVAGRGVNPDGTPKRMKYAQDDRVNEVAVLVGDYEAVDDPAAQKTLKKLKYALPEALDIDHGKGTSQAFAQLRREWQKMLRSGDDDKDKGPMRHAFITTNPLLPKEYYAPKGVDKLVLQMNEDVKHSLLDCKGMYTVKIATFTGRTILNQNEIKAIEAGEKAFVENEEESSLARAARKAHELTTALRAKGVEAYEFHDRESSIVTIGSFNNVGSPRQDGKIEINPQVHAIMKEYGGQQSTAAVQLTGGSTAPGVTARKIAGITLDIQPMPVEVPRRSFASDYKQASLIQ